MEDTKQNRSELKDSLLGYFLADLILVERNPNNEVYQPPLPLKGELAWSIPSAYTAFNGDHFALVPLMRKYAISQGRLPLNPESIVGYRDSVLAYQSKSGVLLADIAALSRCDEMWIFSTALPALESVGSLAEGVAVELLFYLENRRRQGNESAVYWVDVNHLVADSVTPALAKLNFPVDLVRRVLSKDNPEVVSFVDRILGGSQALPRVAFCLHDPLDSKYADWLGAGAHLKGYVPLVPSKAIELGDGPTDLVLFLWLGLLRYADEVWSFPSVETRSLSRFQSFLGRIAIEHLGMVEIPQSWAEFDVPKIKYGDSWPLTARERRPVALVRGIQ
ncbi:hypothetical protein [Pseudarthrobacter sp. TAF60_1]|uniref:hypothetical protein n=1 Tax=Pseudarthrobacter sp. TAF60_1 TaxID=3233071 RepID=UPI003F9D5045